MYEMDLKIQNVQTKARISKRKERCLEFSRLPLPLQLYADSGCEIKAYLPSEQYNMQVQHLLI
jgi:hypothetical protein